MGIFYLMEKKQMFNYQQRQELNDLSSSIFGIEGYWRKLMEMDSYRVPTGETKIVNEKQYVKVEGRKDKNKITMIEANKAHQMGIITDEQLKEFLKPKEVLVTRDLGYDELVSTLRIILDSKIIQSGLTEFEARYVYAYRFVKKQLRYSFVVIKTGDEGQINELLTKVPRDIADELLKFVSEDAEVKNVTKFDYIEFLNDVITALSEDAETKYDQIIDSALKIVTQKGNKNGKRTS